MVAGFKLIDADLGWPPVGGELWDVVQVNFGHQTDWRLQIQLERNGQTAWIAFTNPVSYRVQDEGEMISYWTVRGTEGVAVGTFYAIRRSEYLDQMSGGVSGLHDPLNHYLVVGLNMCVEVIDLTPPDQLIPAGSLDLAAVSPAT